MVDSMVLSVGSNWLSRGRVKLCSMQDRLLTRLCCGARRGRLLVNRLRAAGSTALQCTAKNDLKGTVTVVA